MEMWKTGEVGEQRAACLSLDCRERAEILSSLGSFLCAPQHWQTAGIALSSQSIP